MSGRIVFLLLFIGAGFVGCQHQPTKTYEEKDFQSLNRPNWRQPIKINENTFVIDARDPFVFSMAHIQKSVNVQWTDFSKKPPFTGLLADDLYFHARRLARMGLSPESEVVVIGRGLEGRGEEMRLAWTLYYMGIENVRYAAADYFSIGWTNATTETRHPSQKTWKPNKKSSVLVEREELAGLAGLPRSGYFQSSLKNQSVKISDEFVVLDVRAPSEFKMTQQKGMTLAQANIYWKNFFDKKGLPQHSVLSRLTKLGITREQRIIVISNQGLRSAAVTMALLDLGYKAAGNYAGGYQELLAR